MRVRFPLTAQNNLVWLLCLFRDNCNWTLFSLLWRNKSCRFRPRRSSKERYGPWCTWCSVGGLSFSGYTRWLLPSGASWSLLSWPSPGSSFRRRFWRWCLGLVLGWTPNHTSLRPIRADSAPGYHKALRRICPGLFLILGLCVVFNVRLTGMVYLKVLIDNAPRL